MANLSTLFLDTAFVLALINLRDQWHNRAVEWQSTVGQTRTSLLTTEFILIEIGDGLANLRFRSQAARVIDILRSSPLVEIVPASERLVWEAFNLYRLRTDKDWGMTECSSFVVMKERGLTDALTMDRHFQQAGFRPLLLME